MGIAYNGFQMYSDDKLLLDRFLKHLEEAIEEEIESERSKFNNEIIKGEIQGIRYEYDSLADKIIILNCPKCNQSGKLIMNRTRSRQRLRIVHETTSCYFGWTSEFFDPLEAIYNRFKRGDNGGL